MAAPNIVQTPMDVATLIGAGVGKQVLPFKVALADLINSTNFLLNWIPGFNGRILALDFVTEIAATTGSKLATLTPSLVHAGVTTVVTGGVLSLTSANCTPAGTPVLGSAVTAKNAFAAGDGITIAIAATAFVEGSGFILLTIVNDDTLTAIAKALMMFNP